MQSKRYQTGFTLVEIAIVLVIIGLLLGGILKGQEMITQARIKNVVNDFNGITAAYFSYMDRYKAVPGDDPNASRARWTHCPRALNGDSDGQISGLYGVTSPGTLAQADVTNAAGESWNFWWHLRLSGFVAGATSGPSRLQPADERGRGPRRGADQRDDRSHRRRDVLGQRAGQGGLRCRHPGRRPAIEHRPDDGVHDDVGRHGGDGRELGDCRTQLRGDGQHAVRDLQEDLTPSFAKSPRPTARAFRFCRRRWHMIAGRVEDAHHRSEPPRTTLRRRSEPRDSLRTRASRASTPGQYDCCALIFARRRRACCKVRHGRREGANERIHTSSTSSPRARANASPAGWFHLGRDRDRRGAHGPSGRRHRGRLVDGRRRPASSSSSTSSTACTPRTFSMSIVTRSCPATIPRRRRAGRLARRTARATACWPACTATSLPPAIR